jgi:hypothetical protein
MGSSAFGFATGVLMVFGDAAFARSDASKVATEPMGACATD